MLEISKNSLNLNSSYEKTVNTFTSSGDIIIPDSKPDVANVLYVDVIPIIDDTAVNSEQLTISGNVEFNVIYSSAEDDSKIIRISTLIPFKNSFEVPNLTSESDFSIAISASSTESKILNERKISLKSIIKTTICFFTEANTEFIDDVANNSGIESLCNTATIPTILCSKCINTSISDSSIINSSLPNIEEIIKYDSKVINEEVVVSDGKVMFKGDFVINVYYTAEDKKIYCFEYTMPYSNFLDNCAVEGDISFDLTSCINHLSIKVLPDSDELMRVLEFDAHISTYICIFESKDVNIISDIYSTNSTLSTKTETVKYSTLSSKQSENINLRGVIDIPENGTMNVLTALGKLKDLSVEENAGSAILSGNIELTLIYKTDTSGNIESTSIDMPINHTLNNFINNITSANLINIEAIQTEPGKFDIKLSLNVNGNTINVNNINLITEITENEDVINNNHGIIIYYPKTGDTLWKIAKKYGTTVDKLKVINNLADSNMIVAGNPLIVS